MNYTESNQTKRKEERIENNETFYGTYGPKTQWRIQRECSEENYTAYETGQKVFDALQRDKN